MLKQVIKQHRRFEYHNYILLCSSFGAKKKESSNETVLIEIFHPAARCKESDQFWI